MLRDASPWGSGVKALGGVIEGGAKALLGVCLDVWTESVWMCEWLSASSEWCVGAAEGAESLRGRTNDRMLLRVLNYR